MDYIRLLRVLHKCMPKMGFSATTTLKIPQCLPTLTYGLALHKCKF